MTIKPGDRVRLTLDQSTVVGVVNEADLTGQHVVSLQIDGDGGVRRLWGRWKIEKITPAEPPPGTVIRYRSNLHAAGSGSTINDGLWVHRKPGAGVQAEWPWQMIKNSGELASGGDWEWFNKYGTVEIIDP